MSVSPGKLLQPIGFLGRHGGRPALGILPRNILAELHRRRQVLSARVKRAKLFQNDAPGPSVADGVVGSQHEYARSVVQHEQGRRKDRAGGEIERKRQRGGQPFRQFRPRQFPHGEVNDARGPNDLGFPGPVERRTERLMTIHQHLQRARQARRVYRAANLQTNRIVVGYRTRVT